MSHELPSLPKTNMKSKDSGTSLVWNSKLVLVVNPPILAYPCFFITTSYLQTIYLNLVPRLSLLKMKGESFRKKLWCCVGGGNKVIWLLSWKCKLATAGNEVEKLTSFVFRSDEGPTHETSASTRYRPWPIYIFNLVDITKLPCHPHRRSTTVSLETFTLNSLVKKEPENEVE